MAVIDKELVKLYHIPNVLAMMMRYCCAIVGKFVLP